MPQNKLIIFRLVSFFILTNLQFSHAVNPEGLKDFGHEGMGSQGVLIDTKWFLTANLNMLNPYLRKQSVNIGEEKYNISDIKYLTSAPYAYAALIYLDRPVLNVEPIARSRSLQGLQYSENTTYYITTLDPLMNEASKSFKGLNQSIYEEKNKEYPTRLVLKFVPGTTEERKNFLNKMAIDRQFTAAGKSTGPPLTSSDPFYVFIQNPFSKKYEFVSIRTVTGSFKTKSVGLSEENNIIPFTSDINTEIDNIIIAKALQNPISAHIGIGKGLTEAKILTQEEESKTDEQGILHNGVFLDSSWLLEICSFSEKVKTGIHVDEESFIVLTKKDELLSLEGITGKKEHFWEHEFEREIVSKLYYLTQPYTDINPTPRARLYPSYKVLKDTKVLILGYNSNHTPFSFTAQTVSDLNAQDLLENAISTIIYGRPINYASIYIYDKEFDKYLFFGAKRLEHSFMLNESINTAIDNVMIRKALQKK